MPCGGNRRCVVISLVVIVHYKLFIVQYKSVDFRAVSAAAIKVPADFLLANQQNREKLLAE